MKSIVAKSHWYRRVILLVLVGGLTLGLNGQVRAVPGLPSVVLTKSDNTGISLVATLPAIQSDVAELASTPGWAVQEQPGKPALPSHTMLLALPPNHRASIRSISAIEERRISGVDVAPVASRVWSNEPLPGTRPAEPQWSQQSIPDQTTYTQDALFPTTLASLGAQQMLRAQAFVPLTLYSAQWNPVGGELRQPRQLAIRVDFVPDQAKSLPQRPDPLWQDSFNRVFANRIDRIAATTPLARPVSQVVANVQGVRLTLPQSGLYTLALRQLADLNVPPAWINTPTYLRFFRGSVEIPRVISGNELIFYLPPYDTKQTDSGGIIVQHTPGQTGLVPATRSVDAPPGAAQSTYSATLHLEQQVFYISRDPQVEGADHWWWKFWFNAGNGQAPTPMQVPFSLDAAAERTAAGSVRLRLHGGAGSDTHKLAVAINGLNLGTVQWSGRTLYETTIALPAGSLSTTNQLTLTPVGTALERGYLDWVEVNYARSYVPDGNRLEFNAPGGTYAIPGFNGVPVDIWDITNAAAPQVVSGYSTASNDIRWTDPAPRRYVVQAQSARRVPQSMAMFNQPDLHSPLNAADYLAITYNPAGTTTWSDALAPLLARRISQGYRAKIIDVQWIYDQFGDGRVDPAAIRAFISYAYAQWTAPAPSYVLLVGDGTDDPHDYEQTFGSAVTNFIPPYLAYVDPWLGETAADNRYVTVAGNDDIPDLHIGRFPASNLQDVKVMVGKTVAYEQTSPDAAWLRRVLLVADNPDAAGDFHALSTNVASVLPTTVLTTTQYFKLGDNVADFRTNLINTINAGQLFVNYIGHAGIDVWGEESLYNKNVINQLTNSAALPIMLPMTCYAGFYQKNWASSLAEHELRQTYTVNNITNYAGAVASWSPTGLGIANGHDYLNRTFFDAVFNQGFRRLGPATLMGKLALSNQGSLAPDLLNTYLIFGDPALQIPLAYAPITAYDDSVVVDENTPSITLDPRTNDINPYQNALIIRNVGQAQHGTVMINRDGTQLIYTPQPGYRGDDSFSYTVMNPANGSQSMAKISIDMLGTEMMLYLPLVQR